MKRSRIDRIAYPLLVAVAVVAVLIERGIENGLWILGGVAYASSLLISASAILSSIAMKKLAFDRLELGLVLFATIFAAFVLLTPARNWFPLAWLTAIAFLAAVIIWALTRFSSSRNMQ